MRWGGGHNIVNVTLVDIRAWDTMGEISVLLVAATGVASLVFLSRRGGQIFRADEAAPERRGVGRARTRWRALRRGDRPGARRRPAHRPRVAARRAARSRRSGGR